MFDHPRLVELRAPRDQRGHQRDADVPAHVAGEVHDAGDLVVLLRRDPVVDHRVDGHEQERDPGGLEDPHQHRGAEIDPGIERVRHVQERRRGHQEPEGDQVPRIHLPEELPHDRQEQDDGEPARRKRHPRVLRRVAHPDLKVERQQHGASVQRHPQHQHHQIRDGEVAVTEEAHLHHRMLLPPFPDDEADQRHRGDGSEDRDGVGIEPILLLPLVQHVLERAEPDGDEAQPDAVDGAYVLLRLHQVRRVHQDAGGEQHRDDAHGHVDEEDPAPRVVVGDEAAERRADGGRHHHRHSVHRECHAALRGRERIREDRLLGRSEAAPADPLEHAEEDQQPEVRREPAEKRACGEQEHAGQIEALAAHACRYPAADGQHHRVAHQVAGEDPGGFVGAHRQAAGDVLQRYVGDGGVQHLHERRHRHDQRDRPGIVAARPALLVGDPQRLFGADRRSLPLRHRTRTFGSADIPGRRRSISG